MYRSQNHTGWSMAARSSDKGDGRHARSRDKWRRILRKSERDAEAVQKAVVALEAEQGRIRCKIELLSVIVEGLGVVIHYMMRVLEKDSTHLIQMQQLEHSIQQLMQQAGEAGFECDSNSSSGHELLYGNVNHTAKHYSTVLLISLFQPEWIDKVLSMSSAAIVARLRELVGKSAILTLKGGSWEDSSNSAVGAWKLTGSAAPAASATVPTDNTRQQQQQQHAAVCSVAAAPAAAAHQCQGQSQQQQLQQRHYEKLWQQHPLGSQAACTVGWQASGQHLQQQQQQQQHLQQQQQQHLQQQQQQDHSGGGVASLGSAVPDHSTNRALDPPNGTSSCAAMHGTNGHLASLPAAAAAAAAAAAVNGTLPAPLEYASIMMTLMLLDEQRFRAIQFMNLEDMSQMGVMPQEFWAAIASKLALRDDQIEMLHCMSAFMEEAIAPLFKSLGETAQEGLEVTHKQEQQLQQQQLPQQQQQLLHVQESLLKRQHQTLQQWQIWRLQMGLLSINTLNLHQMGLLQVFSYPNCPRMDMVLKDLLTQPSHQGQQQTQQQQPAQQVQHPK